jgi:hypothetical protein
MASNVYHFISRWRVEATVEEVNAILKDAASLPRWWPSVYLDVTVLNSGDAQGVGKVVSLYTKGWLPYTLRWKFRVTESRSPYGYTLEAMDDLTGRGIWTFEPDGRFVNITYDWRIAAEKPFLKTFSFLLKPLFAANHRWAMAKGEESLRLELLRRRATSEKERQAIPPPPPPTFVSQPSSKQPA